MEIPDSYMILRKRLGCIGRPLAHMTPQLRWLGCHGNCIGCHGNFKNYGKRQYGKRTGCANGEVYGRNIKSMGKMIGKVEEEYENRKEQCRMYVKIMGKIQALYGKKNESITCTCC